MINQATLSVYILIFLFHQLIFVLQSITHSLLSARVGTPSTGTVQIKLGFVPTSDAQNLLEFDEIYTELIKCSRPSLVSALAVSFRFCSSFSISKCTALCQTEGIGTVRSNKQQAYDDDGGLSSDAGNSDDEGEFTDAQEDNSPTFKPSLDVQIPNTKPPELVIHPASTSPSTPTPGNQPTPMPKIKLGGKKFSGLMAAPASRALASPAIDAQGAPVSSATSKNKFVRSWSQLPFPLPAVGTKVRKYLQRNVNQISIFKMQTIS